jgi:epoxyqueuosine reductase
VNHAGDGLRSPDPLERARAVLARCREHGFAVAGIAEARPSAHAAAYRAWIAEGKQGGMGYLAEEIERRLDPGILVPGARSVLCVADRYADGRPDRREPGMGRIARYSRGEDYHVVIRARLEAFVQELARLWPGQRLRVCVDTAPLLEREHAERAGVGRIGKHTLLIAPGGMGSWVLLGAVVSTVELAPIRADGSVAPPAGEGDARDPALDPCGSCTRCIDACPTGAITPWSVDARRCISAVTIEERGSVPTELVGRTGDWLFGCDDCQEACPHSQPTNRSRAAGVHEAYRGFRTGFPLLELLGWDDAAWEAALLNGVLRRGSASMWRRNAALAAAAAIRSADTPEPLRAELRAALAAVALDARATAPVRDAARDAIRDADA